MATYYLDSSALVKRYVQEIGSSWLTGLFDAALGNEVFIAAVTPVEILAAISRRARGSTMIPADATAARSLFRAELLTDYQVVELTKGVLNRAMDLAETHGLRGYDAVQLAAALETNALAAASGLPPLMFICADGELNTVAQIEGLRVDNPNHHP